MADVKISALPAATTPLAGTEVLPIVQSSTTRKVSVADLTAGRAITASNITDSGLTSGRVTYATTGGLLTDSANMTFDGSTLTTLNSAYTGTLTGGTGIVNLGSGQFYKDASGNVGIGVTPSAYSSETKAIDIGAYGVSISNTAGYQASYANNAYYNAGWKYKATGYAPAMYAQNSGSHSWNTAPSGTAGNAITFTQAMTLDNSGNLGVGATSGFNAFSGTETTVYIKNAGANVASLYLDASRKWSVLSGTSGQLAFYDITGGAERMRIDSSGNLLVGGTSLVNINTNGGFSYAVAAGQGYFVTSHASGTPSGQPYNYFFYNNAVIGSITQSGTTGVLYNLTSDYRLKNDQQPLTGAKEFIMALQPKKWQWWDGSGEGVGFIAHEFMEVAKYSGNGEKDAVDADGKPVYQSIQPSSSEVMANLIAHIQQLETRLAALENK